MRLRALIRTSCAAGLLAVTVGIGASAAASTSGVPFSDPNSDGYIGFCDLAGHNVTSGSLDSAPFVWKAVSSVLPPKGYAGPGQNAALYIYQARPGILPGDWSGDGLTSASHYANSHEPTAVSTYKDFSLKVITTEYPPKWDGLYELRMQFGKVNYGVYSTNYPTAVIQVTGDTWRVVSGGLVNCAKAVGVSQESISAGIPQQPLKRVKGETPPTATPQTRAGSGTTSGLASSAPAKAQRSAGPLTQTVSDPISAPVTLKSSGGGVSRLLIVVLVVAGIVAAGLIGSVIGRRRSPKT